MNPLSVRVVGLGSDHGDDRAGWAVAARLRETGVEAQATSDPFAVADASAGCELLVVIDACRGAGPTGSVHRFEWPDARLADTVGVSSHGVGLAATLRLAEALGKLPPRVIVFAVEAESGGPGAALSPAVEAAIPEVVARVLAEAAAQTGGSG